MKEPEIHTIIASWIEKDGVWAGQCDGASLFAASATLDALVSGMAARSIEVAIKENRDPNLVLMQIVATGNAASLASLVDQEPADSSKAGRRSVRPDATKHKR